jgi:uncharacterized Rossmann fold enzyme
MSEILVNKLTGTSTAGSILVTGEGNSTTTNLQQGLAKCFVLQVNSASSFTTRSSFNLASTTDNADGDTTYALTSAMSSDDFVVVHGIGDNANQDKILANLTQADGSQTSASQYRVTARDISTGSYGSVASHGSCVMGDLA